MLEFYLVSRLIYHFTPYTF